jgi:hypothetical protein
MSAQLALWIQYAGLALAMVGGAPWPQPQWLLVATGLAVVGVGIALKRAADRHDPRLAAAHGEAGPAREGSVPAASQALPEMVARARALAAEARALPLAKIAEAIEALQQAGPEQVAAAQDALVRAYTFAGYARVMTPLATGERLLYRAWSAASDGHRDEAVASLEAALPYLDEARDALATLTAARA